MTAAAVTSSIASGSGTIQGADAQKQVTTYILSRPRRLVHTAGMPKKPVVTPRKAPTQERARATVDAILRAAARLLVKDGWHRLTTNRIAERAGVNIASLYQYFPNKEAIVVELQRRHVTAGRAEVERVLASLPKASPRARLRAGIEANVALHLVEPELHRALSELMPQLVKRKSVRLDADHHADAERMLREAGFDHPNNERVAWVVSTVMHAVTHEGVRERLDDMRSGALADELVILVERYLSAPRKTPTAVRKRPS